MRASRWWIGIGVLLPLLAAAREIPEIEVHEPYIELHTAPNIAYPIFDVAERGEHVQILKLRTGWFKVRTAAHQEGWVLRSQMQESLNAAGLQVDGEADGS